MAVVGDNETSDKWLFPTPMPNSTLTTSTNCIGVTSKLVGTNEEFKKICNKINSCTNPANPANYCLVFLIDSYLTNTFINIQTY